MLGAGGGGGIVVGGATVLSLQKADFVLGRGNTCGVFWKRVTCSQAGCSLISHKFPFGVKALVFIKTGI
jgi:hypothetical protein